MRVRTLKKGGKQRGERETKSWITETRERAERVEETDGQTDTMTLSLDFDFDFESII